MLRVKIPDQPKEQLWDEINECFVYTKAQKGCELNLEHSLLSVSKWETIWCKAFLDENDKTVEEMLSYIECMTISPTNLDPEIYKKIPQSEFGKINKYINSPASVSPFSGSKNTGKGSTKGITSEMIYFRMIQYNIPFECQKWHLNRLLALIKVCEMHNEPQNKKSRSANEISRERDRINEARKKSMHSKG